jgi:hypothetical protein
MRLRTAFFSIVFYAAFIAAGTVYSAPSIVFEYTDDGTTDAGTIMQSPSYAELEEKYSTSLGKYLIQDTLLPLTSGDYYRLILTCASVDGGGACAGIQLSAVDERNTPASIIQRINLGNGYAPQILTVSDDARGDVMFRVIRAGDNTEAYVYSINPVTGRLTDTMAVTRAFPEKMKLDITGVMREGGIIEIEYNGSRHETMDLSEALDSLIEDGLYQPDGTPIPALRNLRLVRSGWEDVNFYTDGDEPRVDVGMSLVTLSGKPVAEVTYIFKKDDNGEWSVADRRFAPSLPYDTE